LVIRHRCKPNGVVAVPKIAFHEDNLILKANDPGDPEYREEHRTVARVSGGQAKRLRDRSRVAIQLAVVLWSMGPAVRENASPYRLFRRFLAAATSLSTLGGSFVHAGQRTYALYGVQPMRSNSSQAWAASTAATRSDGGQALAAHRFEASARVSVQARDFGGSGKREW
jgi:hypothetical protein